MIHDLGERGASIPRNVFADAVKDHDRVVHGEADDREHGGDKESINLNVKERASNREEANRDDHVMQERDECRSSEAHVSESVGHPEHDPE